MDHGDPPANRRKLKFAPKSASQRKPRPAAPKPRTSDDGGNEEDEAAKAQKLMTRFNENLRRQANRAEKRAAPVQVAFGSGASPSLSIRKFGFPKAETSHAKASAEAAYSDPDAMQIDGSAEGGGYGAVGPHGQRTGKKYKEPFDYESYYPISLPLRKPFSGDPDVLNEEEFGKAAMDLEYDENSIKHASELGLLEKSDEVKMLLFKFPPKMPYINQSISSAKGKEKVGNSSNSSPIQSQSTKGKEKVGSSSSSSPIQSQSTKGKEKVGSSSSSSSFQSQSNNSLEQFPKGYLGKMVVYKSGAVKFKIGDVLYDVAQGSDCTFHQQVMAVNTAKQQCSDVGEIEKHAVVSLNVDSILDSVINLD